MERLAHGLHAAGMEAAWYWPVGRDWREQAASIPRSPEIAAVIVNGEGSIHRSATRPRAAYLPAVAPFAREVLGVPCFLINATLYDIDGLAAKDLHAFERIFVRDAASLRELRRHGLNGSVVPDLSLAHLFQYTSARTGIRGTDSVLKEIAGAIEARCLLEGWAFVPIKHKANDFAQSSEYAARLSASRLVLTGRFHAVCMCLVTRTPFVAVESNTPKISSLVSDVFGTTRRVLLPEQITTFTPAHFQQWSSEETAALDRFLAGINPAIADMFATIRKVVNEWGA